MWIFYSVEKIVYSDKKIVIKRLIIRVSVSLKHTVDLEPRRLLDVLNKRLNSTFSEYWRTGKNFWFLKNHSHPLVEAKGSTTIVFLNPHRCHPEAGTSIISSDLIQPILINRFLEDSTVTRFPVSSPSHQHFLRTTRARSTFINQSTRSKEKEEEK